MGSYFADKWDGFTDALAFISTNPGFFLLMLAIFAPLIWWKWRVTGRSMAKAQTDLTHGLRHSADLRKERHESGIGTQEVFVMRSNKVGGMIWFALIFFGGGAVFYALVVLPDAPTRENWLIFAGLGVFASAAMALIERNQTRILLRNDHFERRRILRRRKVVSFRDIATVEPRGMSLASGVRLTTKDGRSLTIGPHFSGYKQLLYRVKAAR